MTDNDMDAERFGSRPGLKHMARNDVVQSDRIFKERLPTSAIPAWRADERKRLIAARLALTGTERTAHAERIAKQLDLVVPRCTDTTVSVYWPYRGEPDLRPWMTTAHGAGLRIALPVVVGKGRPLEFREWHPGCRLEKGVLGILFPADGPVVVPTVVIAPLVGFDPDSYRLGYGGGFFDRTLAALSPRPFAIGVGHPVCAIPTIRPLPHDIPMDRIVDGTEPLTAPIRKST